MTMTLTEYFVRHYSLVIDNDQDTYNAANEAAQNVIEDSGISLPDYTGRYAGDHLGLVMEFAGNIGDAILSLVEEWYTAALDDNAWKGAGDMLIREIMITSDADIAYHLGKQYLPEPADMENYLLDDSEDDDES